MEFFKILGVNLGALVAVVGITEYIKKADPKNKLKRFYLFLPILLSVLAAVAIATNNNEWQSVPLESLKYFGISQIGYGMIKKVFAGQ